MLAATGLAFLAVSAAVPPPEPATDAALTKVYLRSTGADGRWAMEGEGPAWTDFNGGVKGLSFDISGGGGGGSTFAVQYINQLDVPTSIHAHGLTPPHALDGVPYVDAPPIEPGRTAVYVYELQAHNVGSYWLHSHYGFQHELGLAIPLVVAGPMPPQFPLGRVIDGLDDAVLFLEDFCSFARDEPEGNRECMDPDEVYTALAEAWEEDRPGFNFTECMPAAEGDDTWDVGYRQHLANGRQAADPATVLVAEGTSFLRLRIINGGDMTNYHVDLGELRGELIATDGQPCVPKVVDSVWLAVAQRADVVVNVPSTPGAYPVFAVVEGDSMDVHVRQSVLVLVVGGASHVPPPGKYSEVPDDAPGMMRGELELDLRAWTPLPPPSGSVKRFTLNLTGDNGFMGINERAWQLPPEVPAFVPNPHPLLVQTGDRVCILLRNFNSDSHPFHLHGHLFEVVRVGDVEIKGAMRDSAIVDPGECSVMEVCFEADNPGVWPIHCHMTYHLAAGMLTTVEYVESDVEVAEV